jgi:ABC-type sugar transport system ATPase subunit
MEAVPILQVENISKAFPGVQALKRVSMDVQRGEVHALIGENGAGKSTLMSIIFGALRAGARFADPQEGRLGEPHIRFGGGGQPCPSATRSKG